MVFIGEIIYLLIICNKFTYVINLDEYELIGKHISLDIFVWVLW